MRAILLSISFSVIFFSFAAFSQNKNEMSAVVAPSNSCKLMGDNLYNCTPYECDTSADGMHVHNKIGGLNSEGECLSEQSNQDGEKVICKYSEESRKFLGKKMKEASTDLTNMPESTEFDENIISDIFNNECEVISHHGDDKPTVTEDDEAILDSGDDEEEAGPAIEDTEGTSEHDEDEDPKKIQDNGDLLDSQ